MPLQHPMGTGFPRWAVGAGPQPRYEEPRRFLVEIKRSDWRFV
jgi:hypothetical protein